MDKPKKLKKASIRMLVPRSYYVEQDGATSFVVPAGKVKIYGTVMGTEKALKDTFMEKLAWFLS